MNGRLNEQLPLTPFRRKILDRIIKRCYRIITDCTSALADYEAWQAIPHNEPFASTIDVEDFLVWREQARQDLEQALRLRNLPS